MVHVDDEQSALRSRKDIIEMPGGGKKFTIRYDSLSHRYWASPRSFSTSSAEYDTAVSMRRESTAD